jgi:DNA helicase-2/ATP-dependent DNA helicase PcrA
MNDFKPSKYQTDIFDFILNDDRNAVISAVAGSGKTTTLIKALEVIPENKTVLFMAFNKNIATELKERAPKNKLIDVKTVHALGYSILNAQNSVITDNNKYRKLFRDLLDYYSTKNSHLIGQYKFNSEHLGYIRNISKYINEELDIPQFTTDINDLSNLARVSLVNFDVESIGINEIRSISKVFSINNKYNQPEVAWYLSKLGLYFRESIDYTDMIALPNMINVDIPKYDFVFIDECQDLNTCQRLLMQKTIKPDGGRFIAVGDPKQSIYAFAGADYESYQKLKQIPNTIELPLSVTYRCAPAIVDMVKDINPVIKSHKKGKSGKIIKSFSYKDIQDSDMVLCRNTFPVVSLCIRLLSEGKKAYIIGSDIGLSLKKLILNQERKSEEFNMQNVFSRLYNEKKKLVQRIMENHGLSNAEALEDNSVVILNEKIQVIEVLSDNINDPNEVIKKIDDLFSNDKKVGICLSNIHKSKGLESERVFILHPELMPSKYAILPWELDQEENLKYVAYTRAKSTLGFITDYDAWSSHKSQSDNVKKVKESKFLGKPGDALSFKLKIVGVRPINGVYGATQVYDMVDIDNNLVSKFGEIKTYFITNGRTTVDVGTEVSFVGVVKEHSEFRGNKITRLGKITKK